MRNLLSLLFWEITLSLGCAVSGCSAGGNNSGQNPVLAATTTTLALSNSSVNTGASVTLTATVASGAGTVTSGTLTFFDGMTQLNVTAVNSSGKAVWSSSSLAAGAHSLTASYGANSSYAASVSSAATLTVIAPTLPTSLALTTSSGTSVQGLPVEIIATVIGTSGSVPAGPGGSVTLLNGSGTLGTASLDPTGVANFTTTQLLVGSDAITATYSGDTNYGSSTSATTNIDVAKSAASTFTNPVTLNLAGGGTAVSCADPAIYKVQQSGVDTWYLYCTSDALFAGDPNHNYLNIFHSFDLVNWTYNGSAFTGLPSWANGSGAQLWAPAIKYFNSQYYLYYATPSTNQATNGPAIGVGTSSSPSGPFVDHGSPVVEPELATNCCAGSYRSTIDPDVTQDASGQKYILFGSFTGGIFVRKLSADGFTSDPSSEQQIAANTRYEGANWWIHNGYYYLFASSASCCNGPLSGYGVFVGRATSPMGPFLDAQGVSMTEASAGGTPVLRMNGNSVIGPGGNVIFTDEAGKDYILYHGIVDSHPYYGSSSSYNARPSYIEVIDWVNGWPITRGGFGPSDVAAPQPLPAAQPGGTNRYTAVFATQDQPRSAIAALSDEFNTASLNSQWSYVHSMPAYTMTGSAYQVPTVGFDTTNAMASVPMLAESSPSGDYLVETGLDMSLPVSGSGINYAQAGLLIYGNDNNYLRLDLYAKDETRQIEFIKGETPVSSGYPSWGGTSLGSPAIATDVFAWLRIAKRIVNGEEHYTAYSSSDGANWIQGGTWVHTLGSNAKICLYAGNRTGFTATFDYVHVSTVQ